MNRALPRAVRLRVAILVFDQVEVLDFAGPFEVFAVSSQLHDHGLFEVGLVSAQVEPLQAMNGLIVTPNWSFDRVSWPDVLVVPGGAGSRQAMHDLRLLRWVSGAARRARLTLSVCGGARILAPLGLLDGIAFTTHHKAYQELAALAPRALLRCGERVVDSGSLVSTGGISAGIDGALHAVARLCGDGIARRTASHMEYPWPGRDGGQPDPRTATPQPFAPGEHSCSTR